MVSMSIIIRSLVTDPPWKYQRSVQFYRREAQPRPYEIILTHDSSMKGQ